jgi:hypothetical protein
MDNSADKVLKDAAKVRRLLKQFAPEMLRAMDKANREAAKPILNDAKAFVPPEAPLTNWGKSTGKLRWNDAEIKKGMVFRAGKKSSSKEYRALLQFKNQSRSGAIFEILGRRTPNPKTPQGKYFVDTIQRKYPRKSRLIWRAVDETGIDTLLADIVQNYETARSQLNNRIRGIG